MHWHEDKLNAEYVDTLRATISDGNLLVFLGSGLSYGAARNGRRGFFDLDNGSIPDPAYGGDDDGQPMPTWPQLVGRMRSKLRTRAEESEQDSLTRFFQTESALDCAEVFRRTVGDQNYRAFLQEQFDDSRYERCRPSPSHHEVLKLKLPQLFTTNYDRLLERTYIENQLDFAVSSTEADFLQTFSTKPTNHVVKLHGTIDKPDTVVLTRTDYSRSRTERRTMFDALRSEMKSSTFLYLGFSLTDPNFNLLLDDVRDTLGMNAPVSYAVQSDRDPVKDRYLGALGINSIWIQSWNFLPDFIRRINPDFDASRTIE
ncbi:SIR2 family protein [Rhodococcoides fascians]|uniref:SIR2 family NAD-dependent protein deacylase n=1 Tax=Rhodococcoides fascians TaxID=1828 RepID=UPI002ACDAB78|nr:SIR2 family protein [Rhodococcus fascians]WQH27577.1 SIR2 family protein [Rhodococcus fascians]